MRCFWSQLSALVLHTPSLSQRKPLREPPAILSSTPEVGQGWAPLSCGMVGCSEINSHLPNVGRKISIRILNQYPFMKRMNMDIVY